MGLHFGILAAALPLPSLLSHLERHTGEFLDHGDVADPAVLDPAGDDLGFAVLAGPHVEAVNFEIQEPVPPEVDRLLEEAAAAIGWEIHPDEPDEDDEDDD